MSAPSVAIALVHHPVIDRRGDLVTTAVTNLDLHDLARTACTYGVGRFYVVTPVAEQQDLVGRLLEHWRQGFGAEYNPDRARALGLVELAARLEDAVADWERVAGAAPLPVLTAARRKDGISYALCRELIRERPLLLVFGTGSGLAPQLFGRGWTVLAGIEGVGDYNHLPVRAAAAIILDRLLGRERPAASE